jgi:hypothetical protein
MEGMRWQMRLSQTSMLSRAALLGCSLFALAATGCQTHIGGQTLPSAYYITDDVQYFPAGPEDKLFNERRALEEYKLEQQSIREGLNDEVRP